MIFIEIENDGFTQTDTREPIQGSQLEEAAALVHSFKAAVAAGRSWTRPASRVRTYTIKRDALVAGRKTHLLGRWHDLPNRVVHRQDVTLKRIGDLCDIKNGLSPNMATPPGDYVLVAPAEGRKTADHWDFDGEGVCIPLVSSSGHGKADIKRIHYQDGKFALATTMCALFVKNPSELRPRFLHLFLEAAKEELMVPLMCGATNVTMNSEQLTDLLVPVPDPHIQDEIIETHLVRTKAVGMLNASEELRASSKDKEVMLLASRVSEDVRNLIETAASRRDISTVLAS